MDIPYKLHIKLGPDEFNAEGPEAVVQKNYELFLATVRQRPPVETVSQKSETENVILTEDQTSKVDSLLQRAFTTDLKRGFVSLRVLPPEGPNKASDAGLLVLYGAHKLLNMQEVPVTRLKKGLIKSGIQVDRVDKIMGLYNSIIIKGGAGVSGKYSLNNPGMQFAEKLLIKILS